MPYDPQASFDPLRSVGAGQGLVSPLAEALQKYEEQRKKTQFNQGVFDILKDKTDSAGKPFIPPEAIARWDSLNPDKQAGYLSAAGSALKEDQERAREQAKLDMQWKIASMKDSPDPMAGVPQPLVTADGVTVPGQFYVPGAKQVVKTTDAKMDDWKKLDADSRAISGVGIGDWTRATNHRMENGMFSADLPGTPAPPGTPPAVAALLSKPGRTLKMPAHEYDSLLSRYNQLSQGSGGGGTAGPAASAPGSAPVTTAAGAAQEDKFIPGKKYRDAQGNVATYLGNGQWQ